MASMRSRCGIPVSRVTASGGPVGTTDSAPASRLGSRSAPAKRPERCPPLARRSRPGRTHQIAEARRDRRRQERRRRGRDLAAGRSWSGRPSPAAQRRGARHHSYGQSETQEGDSPPRNRTRAAAVARGHRMWRSRGAGADLVRLREQRVSSVSITDGVHDVPSTGCQIQARGPIATVLVPASTTSADTVPAGTNSDASLGLVRPGTRSDRPPEHPRREQLRCAAR